MNAYLDTDIGCFGIHASEKGLLSVRIVEKREPILGKNKIAEACKKQLSEYFAGERQEFDLPFDWTEAPAFQKRVWAELLKIPYGRTTSYGAIATKLGDPNACRAVGMANRMNPIPIIVPCHRVNAKNGDLHGYNSGLETKRFLLQLENPKSFAVQGSLF